MSEKVKYLTFEQARQFADANQHLIGDAYSPGEQQTTFIRAVIVAPYSRILQWKFLRLLSNGVSELEALRICVNGRFDVIVLPDLDGHEWAEDRCTSIRLSDYLL